MNTIPAKELKRRGVAALEELLPMGPVHILKNNRPVCVVLTEEEYRTVTGEGSAGGVVPRRLTVLDLFARPASGKRKRGEIDARIREERNRWGRR